MIDIQRNFDKNIKVWQNICQSKGEILMKEESENYDFKKILKEQFETAFMVASANMFMNIVDFREWNRYCHSLMNALKSGVVSKQDIKTFAHSLRDASVITITIPEHEEYLKNLKVLDLLIDTINLEQGQTKR